MLNLNNLFKSTYFSLTTLNLNNDSLFKFNLFYLFKFLFSYDKMLNVKENIDIVPLQ